ncbi:hypothetical protein N8368_01275 [Bacteroidia bacterium]|nr:hypothetical protein [Bacteroidia bacterium]MDB4107083.1 hypothetical protein [Bacteroidia bacterium]MDB9882613.1 hypothetical protein [Bacteroidia bacterium]MDC1395119.1 hypothetical protein [Bacteroidia bacterium]
MKYSLTPLILIILILSSCSTIHKNGYHQSRKYSSKTISFKNKSKIKESEEERLSFDFSKKVRNSTPVEKSQKPSEVDLHLRNYKQVSAYNSEYIHIPKNRDKSNFQSNAVKKISAVSLNKTDRTLVNNSARKNYHKNLEPTPNENKGDPRFAKLALITFLLFIGLFFIGVVSWNNPVVIVSIALLVATLVLAAISFFKNKSIPSKERHTIVRAVNIALIVALSLISLLLTYIVTG